MFFIDKKPLKVNGVIDWIFLKMIENTLVDIIQQMQMNNEIMNSKQTTITWVGLIFFIIVFGL
jgi:hypothetical protein